MEHKKCEVLITFMLGFIHRFISTDEFEPHCDALFGTDEWRAARTMEGVAKEQFLRQLYQRRLLDAENGVAAKYVRYFTMKDARNRTIYDLFFATNHSKGIDSMKDAMWRVDQSGGISFSDATDPSQVTLFTAEPDWNQLFDLLHAKFQGTKVRWPLVEEAIRRSPFRIMRNPLKLESKKPDSRFKIINPPGVRQGTLDADTVIRFP
jgi:hypothetical protein